MKPGITRAVPMGILGFIIGLLVVTGIRALQGLDPAFDLGMGLILAAFTSSGFFVWGMGGFDPSMSEHPHEPEVNELGLIVAEAEEDHDAEAEAEKTAPPFRVLGFSMWQVSFWLILTIVLVWGFAWLPTGLTLQVSTEAEAQRSAIGTTTLDLPFLDEPLVVSQMTAFIGVVIVILLALGAVAGGIALLMTSLSRNVTEAKQNAPTRLAYHPEPREPFLADIIKMAIVAGSFVLFYAIGSPIESVLLALVVMALAGAGLGALIANATTKHLSGNARARAFVKDASLGITFIVMFPLMYILHYEVFVGLPFANPDWFRTLASVGGTVVVSPLVTFLLYPERIAELVRLSLAGTARWMRGGQPATTPDIQQAEEAN